MDYISQNDYELIYKIKEENEESALQELLKKYNAIIVSIAINIKEKNNFLSLDIEDLIQEGRVAVVEAVRTFDDSKEVLFYTYVIILIKRTMNNYLRKINTKNNNILDTAYDYSDYENFLKDDSLMPDKIILEQELYKYLREFKYNLSMFDALVFDMRLNSFSYEEIALFLDIDKKKVDNSMQKIRKKLKKYLLDFSLLL